MGYEIVRDENGKIADVKVNGKPVKRGFMRGMRKAQETSYWQEITREGCASNPFSGVVISLNPLEYTIYNFCDEWYRRYEGGLNTEAPIQTFDDMKYFLYAINAKAYMDLLD